MFVSHYNDDVISYHHTIERSPKQDCFPLHMHFMCELYYFISGDGYQSIEGTNYPLIPESIYIMREEEAHCLHIESDATYERMAFHFPFSFIEENVSFDISRIKALFYDREAGKQNMFILPPDAKAFVACCLDKIFDNEYSDEPIYSKLLTYLIPVLNELSRCTEMQKHTENSMSDIVDSNSMVKTIINYVNSHLYEISCLNDLEKHFYVSSTYMNILFKKTTGTTIWDYIMFKRLLNARKQLREGIPAATVAKNCGAKDYSSFYRMYKKRFGVSPLNDKTK